MSGLLKALCATAVALVLIAGAVFEMHDRSVLVPPPEAVVESFTRQLQTRRYERAVPYLARDLAREVDADSLRRLTEALENRAGRIRDVTGEPGEVDEDRAQAHAILETDLYQSLRVTFSLAREQGVWGIADLSDLETEAGG